MKFTLYLSCLLLLLHHAQAQDTAYKPLTTVIVTANKLQQRRIESPIAIALITPEVIAKTKASRIDFLLNKVSGVYMPTIGNEQHMMAIRQPISLKGLYLYLEDGIPIRTSGLFSNNALIEINASATHSIEVIKGPASALYGAEAIGGVVNFLTKSGTSKPVIEFNTQANNLGLKRLDLTLSGPTKKGTWIANVSWSDQRKGPMDYSDFSKKAISLKKDFTVNKKWSGYQSFHFINYYAQMTGSVDSVHFAQKNFTSLQSFTFRKINALRIHQNLQYTWNANSFSRINLMYRNNTMDQNPTYSIASTNNPIKFKGLENSNHFNSVVIDMQQVWNFKNIKSKLIAGGYWDGTKQNIVAHFINIIKDTASGKYISFNKPTPDSLLTAYNTSISNKAVYLNFLATITNTLSMNLTMRYDNFKYLFNNTLNTGTPSSNNNFTNWTPKIGFTYNRNNIGGYINYSGGFVPPQITEIYNAIRIPYLLPQQFKNFEFGAWGQYKNLYAEFSLYQLNGENEIISVRQADGVNLNQNSGSTKHIGIEYQLKYKASKQLEIHWNATNTKHTYQNTLIKGTDVSGNEMNAAPRFFSNLSLYWNVNAKWQSSLEWQHQSSYFMDETNATTYPGFDVLNYRMSFKIKRNEFWLNLLNLTNAYYATMATKNFSVKGSSAYSYYMGEPRNITIGWKWTITK
jgi:outer membrane receptor protein involved in Fe transport